MSAALFGNTSRSTSKHLVEFKAGKMYMQGKMVHPDKRKGLIYIYQADDTLLHFCWKDRSSGTIEEDLIVFPDDCEFKRITQCTTGRVFVLRFKSNNRRLFFWMQEASTDKDAEYLRKVNEHLNNPPTPGSGRTATSTPNPVLSGSDLPNLNSNEFQNLIGNISQQQLMQILGSGMPSLATLLGPSSGSGRSSSNSSTPIATSSTTSTSSSAVLTSSSNSSSTQSSTTTTAPVSGSTQATPAIPLDAANRSIQLSDLQNILSGISVPSDANEESSPSGSRSVVDLASSLTAEALQPILTNKEFTEKLRPFLPSTEEQIASADQLRGTVTSPQFQQAVSLFTTALQSGQLGPLISQFGLGDEAVAAAQSANMEAFIKALSKAKDDDDISDKPKEEQPAKKKPDDDDESMALD